MKYSILGFNQERVLALTKEVKDEKNGKTTTISIDVEDLLILSVIADIQNRKSIRKVILEDGQYAWISYNVILEDLPILRIDKKQLRRRLDKLVEFELIDLKVERVNGSGTFVYIKIGKEYEALKYNIDEESKYTSGQKSTEGVDKNVHGGGQKCLPKDSLTKQEDNNTDDKEEIDKSISKKKAAYNANADLSYVDSPYASIWQEWLDYKKEIKKQYKTQRGAESQYKVLIKYANNNPILANAIVKISIEHSWDGIFPLSDKQMAFFLSPKSPYALEEKGYESSTDSKNMIPNGLTKEQYDMYISNGYKIAEDGMLLKDGIIYK